MNCIITFTWLSICRKCSRAYHSIILKKRPASEYSLLKRHLVEEKNLFCSVVYEAISRSVSCFLVGILPWVQCTVSVEKLNGEFSHAWLYEAQEKPRSTTLASWRLVRLPASCTSSKKWAQHFSEDVAIVTKELRRQIGTFWKFRNFFSEQKWKWQLN